MIDFKAEVVKLLGEEVKIDSSEIEKLVEIPPSYDMGDYAFPCFRFAKDFRKAPNLIAEELAEKLDGGDLFKAIEAKGPYINFFVNRDKLVETVIEEVLEKNDRYGSQNIGRGRTVTLDFSSPNIAKPFHIGHIRTTVIGNALRNIYEFEGFNTVAINHLGDYGTQFGMLIAAIRESKDENILETIEKDPIKELLKLYVGFNAKIEEKPELKDEARYWFKELENHNEYAVELWNWIRDMSIKEFNKVYKMLGMEFDSYKGESFYSDKMDAVVEKLEEKNLLEESDGALVVDLEDYDMPPALIKKADGSSLYTTRDIAAAIYRKENYDFYKNIYVVASEQNLHFKQWIKVVELMGNDWAKDCIHVPFGMVSLEDGKLSTRKGRVVYLEDVLNKAVDSTLKIIEERNPDLENKEEVARQVGIGAVMFQELFNGRIKDYVFSWDRTLSFEGETGPYVQYTYARANSLIKKGDFKLGQDIDYSILNGEEEIDLVRAIYDFPTIVYQAMEKNEPSFITRHIVEIAKLFNKFYTNVRILSEDQEERNARLALSYVSKTVIKVGLAILGIEAPEKM